MITTIMVMLLTCILAKFDLIALTKLTTSVKPLIWFIIITTLIFWTLHLIISKDKSFDKFNSIWYEPAIIILQILYSIIVTILIWVMIINVRDGRFFLSHTLIIWILLVLFDIANVYIIFKTYSYDMKESIIDSIFLQIREVRNALIMVCTLILTIKFTIVGILVCVILIGAIISFFKWWYQMRGTVFICATFFMV